MEASDVPAPERIGTAHETVTLLLERPAKQVNAGKDAQYEFVHRFYSRINWAPM